MILYGPIVSPVTMSAPLGYGETSPKLARLMRERRRAAFADLNGDLVDAETGTGSEGQRGRLYGGWENCQWTIDRLSTVA